MSTTRRPPTDPTTNFLSGTRAANLSTRMGPDMRNLIEGGTTSGIGGFSLFVNYADVDDPNVIAYTDGKTISAGPLYNKRPVRERPLICSHELLHVALQHPARARTLQARHADFDNAVYNIATDAIINSSLAPTLGVTIPEDLINFQTVLEGINEWPEGMTTDKALARWSSEALYLALKAHKTATGKSNATLAFGDKANAQGPYVGDLIPGSSRGETQADRDTAIRDWGQQFRRHAGHIPGLVQRLNGELPDERSATPWERALRDFLHHYGSAKPQRTYSRPMRRWCALEHYMRTIEGVQLPYQPGNRPGPSGNIAVAVDTSGSIDADLLRQFSGEIASIMERTGCTVRLIVCDAAVHEVETLKGRTGIARLRTFAYSGGGGTHFTPAIEEAAKWQPDAMVYLTDLLGDAGPKPRFPVLWATPLQYKSIATPYGRRINLD